MADSTQLTSFSSTDSGSKHRKLSNNSTDRVSNLPDSVLVHILSFLPTVDAVATAILSRRWKSLWMSVPNLHFEYRPFLIKTHADKRFTRFAEFVYRVFVLRDGSRINKFKLYCSNCDSVDVNTWVCASIERGVQELDLDLVRPVELPSRLFTCNTIVALKLNRGIVLNVPPSVYFPSLKILYLNQVKYPNNDSFRRLFSGCPILENLSVSGKCCSDEALIFNICAPVLKNLTIDCEQPEYKFEINAPALKYLSITFTVVNYVTVDGVSIENISSLVEAKVDVRDGNFAVKLLRELYNVKFLSLSGYTMQPLEYASNYDLPMFPNLTRLEMDISCSFLHLLPNLLESSHNLEVLMLKLEKDLSCHGEHQCWRHLQRVPKCISSKLTTIDISGYEGLKDERSLVRYILKNAEALNTMKIRSLGLNKETNFSLLQELSMFPRGSKTCQVAFS